MKITWQKKTLFKKKHEAFTNMTFSNNFNESFMVTFSDEKTIYFRELVICCCFNLAGSGKVPEVENLKGLKPKY